MQIVHLQSHRPAMTARQLAMAIFALNGAIVLVLYAVGAITIWGLILIELFLVSSIATISLHHDDGRLKF